MTGSGFSRDDVAQVVSLLGSKAQPIHMPLGSPEGVGGGDVDCFVWDLDESWPLRLPAGWRLLQILQYDTVAWYWILERDGDVIAIDTLADPWGIGQYAWPVRAASLPLGAGQSAGYLTTKRLRKGIRKPEEWARIRGLAQEDPDAFRASLQEPFGGLAASIAGEVLANGRPDASWERARAGLKWRRVRTPDRALRLAARQVVRVAGRWARPTGLSVLLVGPDGTGKSTVAAAVLESCAPMFRRTAARHWRPGLLPRSGDVTGAPERDPTRPHDTSARGAAASLAAAAYHWLDFLVAGLTVDRFGRVRSTLLVSERGWEDVGNDPLRYRLNVPPQLIRAAARVLPKPDLVFVLRATPAVAAARKAELPVTEIARQAAYWDAHPPRGRAVVAVDADAPVDDVVARIREQVVETLNRRALARVGTGWAGLPRRAAPRWWIPRGPRAAAAAGLAVYQPVTRAGLAGWTAARAAARAGAFRALRRGPGIPEGVRAAVAPHLPRGGSVAALRANHPGRHVALVLDAAGAPAALVKVATDEPGAAALAREAGALEGLARTLPPPLRAPRLLARSAGVCVTEAVAWEPRRRPWRLETEVARALGVWYAGHRTEGGGPAHGDFAPWNLLRADDGWVLVDWEALDADAAPFHDVFHYLVQSHALLGRPAESELLDALEGRGEIAVALAAFAGAAGLSTGGLAAGLAGYLRSSAARIDPATADGAAGMRARSRLLATLEA